ncbi:phage tail protein [Staphylococcus xylosus]|uniref:Ig-like domain-containing protein n=1 Tax=Staphylococcus xylosus TaxID=1288 RepID=UPI000852D95E|nr:Ig-like domain-containing protein [Staphylococcus xylosus]OEL06899.1 phage tail protein [Staphylococcus xylosus]
MADILKIHKDNEVIATGQRGDDGKANVTISGLEANTTYSKGTFKASWSNAQGESEKVDIEAFTTNPIKVTGVSFDKESLELSVGDTETLVVNITPGTATDKSVTYITSNEEVASIDNEGLVTALSPGTSEITVKTNDGNKTAKVNVNVTE